MLLIRVAITSLRARLLKSMSAKSILAVGIAALIPAAAFAGDFTFTDTGLQNLAHGTAYTWGLSPTQNSTGTTLGALESAIRSGETIGTATLTITGLYDWTNEPNDVLYVNLLNNVKPGNASYTYNSNPNDHDTTFGKDVFDTVTKPTAPTAPTPPTKPTLKLPKAPKKPTLKLPTPPAPLSAHPTAAQVRAYNTALATYNTKLTAYNAAQADYNAALATYNTDLGAYNAAQAAYTAAQAAYTAAHAIYNTNLAAYNAALATYNNYIKTQGALGFTGVPQSPVPGGLYDQANSLLVSSSPNGPGTWTDLNGPSGVTNLTIILSDANISLLDTLLADSATTDLGFGFGPDCHFYDTKITFHVTTLVPVPDGGMTLVLLSFALVGLAGVGRFAKRSIQS